jgi:hypothetical protein
MNAKTLAISDLPSLSLKDCVAQNAAVSTLGGKAYRLANQDILWTLGDSKDAQEAIKVAVQFNGQNMVLGLSSALINALLAPEGGNLDSLNLEIIELVARIKLLPKLPQGIALTGIYLDPQVLPENLQALPLQVSLSAHALNTKESLSWGVNVYALAQTSLKAFLKCFDVFVTQAVPSPLLKATVPMPLVVAKTTIPAQDLLDIAIGDVILIG